MTFACYYSQDNTSVPRKTARAIKLKARNLRQRVNLQQEFHRKRERLKFAVYVYVIFMFIDIIKMRSLSLNHITREVIKLEI